MNKKNGFSLMELIIVIVIIGILISAVVGLNGQKETAKISAAEQVVIQLSNAAQSWAVMKASENYTTVEIGDKTKAASLVGMGILPSEFDVEKANPWAGDIKIEKYSSSKNHFQIVLDNIPTNSCAALSNKFQNKAYVQPVCGTPVNTDKSITSDITIVF